MDGRRAAWRAPVFAAAWLVLIACGSGEGPKGTFAQPATDPFPDTIAIYMKDTGEIPLALFAAGCTPLGDGWFLVTAAGVASGDEGAQLDLDISAESPWFVDPQVNCDEWAFCSRDRFEAPMTRFQVRASVMACDQSQQCTMSLWPRQLDVYVEPPSQTDEEIPMLSVPLDCTEMPLPPGAAGT